MRRIVSATYFARSQLGATCKRGLPSRHLAACVAVVFQISGSFSPSHSHGSFAALFYIISMFPFRGYSCRKRNFATEEFLFWSWGDSILLLFFFTTSCLNNGHEFERGQIVLILYLSWRLGTSRINLSFARDCSLLKLFRAK